MAKNPEFAPANVHAVTVTVTFPFEVVQVSPTAVQIQFTEGDGPRVERALLGAVLREAITVLVSR